jgi:hypothetical protein
MKPRQLGFAIIVVLQACSTAPTSEVSAVKTVETTAEGECQIGAYRWTDEEGNLFYGVSPQSEGSAEQIDAERLANQLQLCCDGQLIASNRCSDEDSANGACREELSLAQRCVIGLYILNPQH